MKKFFVTRIIMLQETYYDTFSNSTKKNLDKMFELANKYKKFIELQNK